MQGWFIMKQLLWRGRIKPSHRQLNLIHSTFIITTLECFHKCLYTSFIRKKRIRVPLIILNVKWKIFCWFLNFKSFWEWYSHQAGVWYWPSLVYINKPPKYFLVAKSHNISKYTFHNHALHIFKIHIGLCDFHES